MQLEQEARLLLLFPFVYEPALQVSQLAFPATLHFVSLPHGVHAATFDATEY